ncbi:MAG: amidohydrolase family protein [Chthoniobacterales bacterium]|nr:amidohydrolase family protein [Chthoniobacterales bacterium]
MRGFLRVIRAKRFVPEAGVVMEDGAVVVREGQIVDSGKWRDVKRRHGGNCGIEEEFEDGVIFPGLINSHAHLEYTCMKRAILPPKSFASWLERVGMMKRTISDWEFLDSIREGMAEAVGSGTTTVLSMLSMPQLLPRVGEAPLRVWWFYELADLRHRIATDDLIAGALMFFDQQEKGLGGVGLSPHSPYLASRELYRLTQLCSLRLGMPWATHVAESAEEYAMFCRRSGELFEFLVSLGRDMSDCMGLTPLQIVLGELKEIHRAILIHLNYLDERDEELLEFLGRRLMLVHCPTSHLFFGHKPFGCRRMEELGVPVALGTDSGATRSSLDLRKELRVFLQRNGWIGAVQGWRMVTRVPAVMLRMGPYIGHLRPGAYADFVVWKDPGGEGEDFFRGLVEQEEGPIGVWVGGIKRVERDGEVKWGVEEMDK